MHKYVLKYTVTVQILYIVNNLNIRINLTFKIAHTKAIPNFTYRYQVE